MKQYLIEFRYEARNGQRLTSRLYADTMSNAKKQIERKRNDESIPRAIEYRIYELKETEILYEG